MIGIDRSAGSSNAYRQAGFVSTNTIFIPAGLDAARPGDVVTACIEQGRESLLLDEGTLPPEFFDLSTGVLGEMAHRASVYGIRVAVVVADPTVHSSYFQAFAQETNRGQQLRFFRSSEEATSWLMGVS